MKRKHDDVLFTLFERDMHCVGVTSINGRVLTNRRRTMNRSLSAASLLISAASIAVPTTGLADAVVPARSICSGNGVYATSVYLTDSGGAPVFCGLIRNNTTNTTGLLDLELRGHSQTGGTLKCTARALDNAGTAVDSEVRQDTIPAGGGNFALDWGNSINISSSKGLYTITCEHVSNATGYYYASHAIHAIYYDEP